MDHWGPEETRQWEAGLPVKTYVPGPGIMFAEPVASGNRPSAGTDTWAHSRKLSGRTRKDRSRQSFLNLLSHYDRTGRLLVPAFSKQVAFEASSAGFNGTARPTTRYPAPDTSPEAVADRIAWATAHRYLSEYYDKYSETANMAATAREAAATARAAATATAAGLKQRPGSAAPLHGSRPGSAMAARQASRPASAAVHSRPATGLKKEKTAADLVAEETFPKDWANIGHKDLARTKPWGAPMLGQHVVPGAQNARLVGSRYRLVPQPVEVEPAYTDFYGPVGGGTETHTYYGRKYTQRPGGIILREP